MDDGMVEAAPALSAQRGGRVSWFSRWFRRRGDEGRGKELALLWSALDVR